MSAHSPTSTAPDATPTPPQPPSSSSPMADSAVSAATSTSAAADAPPAASAGSRVVSRATPSTSEFSSPAAASGVQASSAADIASVAAGSAAPPAGSSAGTSPPARATALSSVVLEALAALPNSADAGAHISDDTLRRALDLFRPAGSMPTLADEPTQLSSACSSDPAALLELICEPQRVFRALSAAYGVSQLDVRTLHTMAALRGLTQALIVTARNLLEAQAASERLRVAAALPDESASSAERDRLTEELATTSAERDRLAQELADKSAELADKIARRDRLAQELADTRAKYEAAKPQLASASSTHHKEVKNLTELVAELSEDRRQLASAKERESSLTKELARTQDCLAATARELSEARAAAAASLGPVDDVADFWIEHAMASRIEPDALRFFLEACRRRSTEGWDRVMSMIMVLPQRQVLDFAASSGSAPGPDSRPPPSPASSSGRNRASVVSSHARRLTRSELPRRAPRMRATSSAAGPPDASEGHTEEVAADFEFEGPDIGDDETMAEPSGSPASDKLPTPPSAIRRKEVINVDDEESDASESEEEVGGESGSADGAEPGSESDNGDDDDGGAGAEAGSPAAPSDSGGDAGDESGDGQDEDSDGDVVLAVAAPLSKRSATGAGMSAPTATGGSKRQRYLTYGSPPSSPDETDQAAGAAAMLDLASGANAGSPSPRPAVRAPAPVSDPAAYRAPVVPRLFSGAVVAYRVPVKASWNLRQRYASMRAVGAYQTTFTIAARLKPRKVDVARLLPTDLSFTSDVTMGVSSSLPPGDTDRCEEWRLTINGWTVQRNPKAPKPPSGFVSYPSYMILQGTAQQFLDSFGPRGEEHLLNLMDRCPWDEMWDNRIRRLYLLDANLLDDEGIRWLKTYQFFMFAHRQAMWEHLHWLASPRTDHASLSWGFIFQRRDTLASYLAAAWAALQKMRPRNWPIAFTSVVDQEAAFWSRPAQHCAWIPNTAGLDRADPQALVPQLEQVDREEPLRIQFAGCGHRFIESLSRRNQVALQFHHYIGVSWSLPEPWNRADYQPAPSSTRFPGTPGPDFYREEFPSELLALYEERIRALKSLVRLVDVPDKDRAKKLKNPVKHLRKLLLQPFDAVARDDATKELVSSSDEE